MIGVLVKVHLLRGYPGAGKSTYVKSLLENDPDLIVVSSDSYFMKNGKYAFDPKNLGTNHLKCYNAFMEALCYRKNICVDNTNIVLRDIKKYLGAVFRVNTETTDTYDVDVVTVMYNSLEEAISHRKEQPDDKNVPEDVIKSMSDTLKVVTDDVIRKEYLTHNINFITVSK
jgi:predicted kinase